MPVTVGADRLVAFMGEYAERLTERLGEVFVDGARSRVSRRTGKTYEGIRANPAVVQPGRVSVTVESTEPSSQYQDEGTGIYGPTGERIYPVTAKALRFDWPAAGGVVFATSVAGSPGSHFWSLTVEDWPQIVQRVARGG